MKKKLLFIISVLALSTAVMAEDHVMAATKSAKEQTNVPKTLNLSLQEAQDYAIKQNRSLKNASLAVQEAYAARWQTIAAMLPQVDGSYSYSNYLGYSASMSMMGRDVKIDMPPRARVRVEASRSPPRMYEPSACGFCSSSVT